MKKNQFIFVLFIAITFGNLKAQDATATQKQIFAGIEVGARGVKYSIIKIQQKDGHLGFVYLKDGSKNTQVADLTSGAIQETSEAVKAFVDTITGYNEKIPMGNIFIAVSSGVKQEADKKPGKEAELSAALTKAVPEYGRPMEVLTSCKEADLTIKGVLPFDNLYTSSLVDIGSGNTKGGYQMKETKASECFNIPLGTSVLTKRLSKIPKTSIKQFFIDSINGDITMEIERKPGLTNRKNTYFSGGIYWAMCNYLYPAKIKDDYTDFTLADASKFLEAAINDYESLIKPDLSAITEAGELAESKKQIERTANTYSQDNIIAGSLIIKSILEELDKNGVKDKRFIFSRFGYVGWISGYIVEKVQGK